MVRLPQYEIFAGTDNYEVWQVSAPNVKLEKISGHDTFDQAAAARARLQAADVEAVARWFAR